MTDEKYFENISKIGGPIVLFVCTPIFASLIYFVTVQDVEVGKPVNVKVLIFGILLTLVSAAVGVKCCRDYLGWFRKK